MSGGRTPLPDLCAGGPLATPRQLLLIAATLEAQAARSPTLVRCPPHAIVAGPTEPTWPNRMSGEPTDIPDLLNPEQIQLKLKLRSRRAARDLIVREMEHIFVGRTPMTTPGWLVDWIEGQRRSPRQPTRRVETTAAPKANRSRRSASGRHPALPAARNRLKLP